MHTDSFHNRDSRPTQTIDGCHAAAHVAYAYSEAAAIFPITPSSPMAELCDEWAGKKRKNIYGQSLLISQMQSEAGAAAAVHGALLAGSLATTFTASQGLLLMLPNLYRMAGELLPGVIHVAARSIATHALSIFGDHSDVYACRQTGMAIFSESSVQEVMDLSPAAHLAAIEGRLPFLNFFDGFRTSHELHKIAVWDYQDLADMADPEAIEQFRSRALHPHNGKVYGSAQNPDIFFQTREAANPFYLALPQIVERQLDKINRRLKTSYGLFDYYGAPDAEHVIIAMGSVCETVKEYIDSVPERKYGLIVVHLYRPFSARHLAEKLPGSVRQITVLDRTKEPGAAGEPLYLDVVAALVQCGFPVNGAADRKPASCASSDRDDRAASSSQDSDAARTELTENGFQPNPPDKKALSAGTAGNSGILLVSGRYGLGSKDTSPAQIAAVYENHTKTVFTTGITDDVTYLSLQIPDIPDTVPSDIVSCKFWGLGGDGTVSATKNAIKIIGNHTDMTAQGYFEYDSKKSRGLTISHLRFGRTPIRSAYLIRKADFVACHNPVYLHKYDMVQEVKDGGSFLLNFHPTQQLTMEKELEQALPESVKQYLAAHSVRLFVIDALGIGKEIGLNSKVSTILQAAFFAVSGLLDPSDAKRWMNEAAEKSYGKSGGKILEMNREAIARGFNEVVEILVPAQWRNCGAIQPQSSAPGPDNYQCRTSTAKTPDSSASGQGDRQGGTGLKAADGVASAAKSQASSVSGASDSQGRTELKAADGVASAAKSQASSVSGASDSQGRTDAAAAPVRTALDNAVLPDRPEMMTFVSEIQQPVTDQRGDTLPVSAFLPYADGYTPPGSTAHERRGVATELPVWKPENCIQCTRCSFVCPHAVIRPAALDRDASGDISKDMATIPMMGLDGYDFAITISSSDCTGCGTCAAVCPGKQKPGEDKPSKALEMTPVNQLLESGQYERNQKNFDACKPLLPCREAVEKFRPDTLKGSQFLRPLLEFSGACAGCGETPYVKLLTQLFGSRMYIANATGCSSIWANSAPSCAYALDENGHGPAWSNSLFEDAAEFGYGMLMAQEAAARRCRSSLSEPIRENSADSDSAVLCKDSNGSDAVSLRRDGAGSDAAQLRRDSSGPGSAQPRTDNTALSPDATIQWIIGGDGWAYDIGFSGLDHILASGKNINILVLNTEVYSNTGGQASKATPLGSTAKFVSGGKKTPRKDLAAMAMTYGSVYVAQIAMGADFNQTVRAFTEAASYPGPSLVIAYATCIEHGIRAGLGTTPHEAKKAVDAGYYHLFRFNPSLREQGKNPFILDSGEPKLNYETFLEGEIRYDSLKRSNPEQAKELFRKAAAQAAEKYESLKKLKIFHEPDSQT